MLLPFSDWAIIQMIKHQNIPLVRPCLRILAPRSSNWKRWSNSLGQFNLLNFCLHDKPLKFNRILKYRQVDMMIKKQRSRTRVKFPQGLKELIVQEIKELDSERGLKPFNQRGEWSLKRYGCLIHDIKWSVKRDFDKSITIWHIATHICYNSDINSNSANHKIEMCKLLSNYMMYLLALRPHMLSMPTGKIIFEHSYSKLVVFLQNEWSVKDEDEACRILRMEELPKYQKSERSKETMVTLKWQVLRDAQRLARSLMVENRWEIISSVWVEMLCYAAANCPVDYHAEQIRRGGGLITHVWLLLAHKTDKYHISD
ncbi:DUF594 family protein [Quillaja saponaria]|uniref:DUF594 family protein n=1 Tax=Quillaja saponaria TaxID=32244 RepID=A0AAD7LCN8_QUISA|nr:DUF594 family protein [Quillaja saponaria]